MTTANNTMCRKCDVFRHILLQAFGCGNAKRARSFESSSIILGQAVTVDYSEEDVDLLTAIKDLTGGPALYAILGGRSGLS